ncbi:unnamed protein product [Nesidiocoris tenuis]|uniref:Uncharacterized protein n=1 Tax=Nesidiocoris tenuis TaxID=355587 RepID=A0A6H5GL04_9HEMI|nr:unnamed protein product [Nesidiocoris tenuis]
MKRSLSYWLMRLMRNPVVIQYQLCTQGALGWATRCSGEGRTPHSELQVLTGEDSRPEAAVVGRPSSFASRRGFHFLRSKAGLTKWPSWARGEHSRVGAYTECPWGEGYPMSGTGTIRPTSYDNIKGPARECTTDTDLDTIAPLITDPRGRHCHPKNCTLVAF